MLQSVDSVLSAFERYSSILANIAMMAMMVIITANTTLRYVFNQPIGGSNSFVELYLMPLLIFGTAALLQREHGNINVDILRRNFSALADNLVDIISSAGGLMVFSLIAMLTFNQGISRIVEGAQLAGVLALPTGPSWLIISFGLLLLCARYVFQIIETVLKIRRGEPADSESESEGGT